MGKLGTFGERLTELMAETELTAKGLAERLGVSSSTVYRWKNDACSIRLSNLIAVSDFFEATFDFTSAAATTINFLNLPLCLAVSISV